MSRTRREPESAPAPPSDRAAARAAAPALAPRAAGRLRAHLAAREEEMCALLVELAACESPSDHPETQAPVLLRLAERLAPLGYRCRLRPGRAPHARSGGMLYAAPRARRGPCQLLLGHADTVWPLGSLAEMPLRREEGRLYGPGTYDMKAGLVQGVFALEALDALGLTPDVAPLWLVNTDEEIGSHDSRAAIRRLARVVDRVFVLEPSLEPGGRLKTARKGVGRFTITVHGRAAHAGLDPEGGVSAILELSHVVQALFALNEPERGVTVNVGQIDGGLRPNVVAPKASAVVDVRVPTHGDAERVDAAIRGLRPQREGLAIEVEGRVGRPPMEPTPGNRALWRRAEAAAASLGMEIDEGTAGGGSDGNFTSEHAPTLDGLGAVGAGAHAQHEHVVTARMPERAALLACLLMTPPLRPEAGS